MSEIVKEFKREAAILLRLIRKHDGLHQDKFDDIFSGTTKTTDSNGHTVIRKSKLRFRYFLNGTYIIGDMSFGDYSKWLHLLQCLCISGAVDAAKTGDKIVYRLIK